MLSYDLRASTPPPTTKVELRFSARGLVNKDVFSLSDPFLVCHTVRHGLPHREIGRTETVQDDLNPVWATTFSFDYDPSVHAGSLLVVDIFDRDSPDSSVLSKHDFLGRAFYRLADLLDAPHMRLDIALHPVRPSALFPAKRKSATSATSSSLAESADLDDADLSATDISPYYDGPASATAQLLTAGSVVSMPRPSEVRESAASIQLRRATSGARAGKVRGHVSVFAEISAATPGGHAVFHVRSALLRDHSTLGNAFTGRKVTQFYEIQRERREGNLTAWSVVYRSADGVNVDQYNYVMFDDVKIDERSLNNGVADRPLRVAFYKRHTRSAHALISYVSLSMADVMQSRFRNNDVALAMEGQYIDDDGLGNVLVKRVERWGAQPSVDSLRGQAVARDDVHVHLRADHFLNRKFISSLNDAPRHARRLRQMPAFITLH